MALPPDPEGRAMLLCGVQFFAGRWARARAMLEELLRFA
jgi:hypothetical protein